MSVRTALAKLRAAVEAAEPSPPLDLSRLTDEERREWEQIEAKRTTGTHGRDAFGFDAFDNDDFDLWRVLFHKLQGRPSPHGGIVYGAYTVPPKSHPQRAAYERGELGFGQNDPNGHAWAPPRVAG